MMTKLEVLHYMVGYALFLFTWELFLGDYFYTRSERKILKKNRGEGLFTTPTLGLIIVRVLILGCGTWLFS
jgi:hypothetical protein